MVAELKEGVREEIVVSSAAARRDKIWRLC